MIDPRCHSVAVLGLFLLTAAPVSAEAQTPTAATLRITSPLGRTGLTGTIRIVARLDADGGHAPRQVDFYVDKLLLASDLDGPPYEALWGDDNPFERRELTARAEFDAGPALTSTVVLPPLQVAEAAEVTSVALEASVVNAKGQFVRGLTAADFAVFENSDAQSIDVVAQKREPALFAVLVDSSQSMAMRADALKAAASRLLEPLAPEDEVLVAPFSRHILHLTGPTTDRATALAAISDITPSGGTAILDALREAAEGLASGSRRRAIVLLTDGYDEHSTSALDATVETLRKSDVTVYVIGVGGIAGISLQGEDILRRLAESTGGRAWFPLDRAHLTFAYEAVAADVQHRYLLTYTPKNQRRDGSYRAIRVTAGDAYSVRTRTGYTAPMAPPVRASLEFTAVASGPAPLSLTRDDIEVREDGVVQTVDTFHESVLPVTIMLALDSSGSMKRSEAEAADAARTFVLSLRPEDEVGMITFANTAKYIHSPTDRRDWSLAALDKYVAEGGTALYDALHDSLAQVGVAKGRRVVVVVTDGRDENAASTGPGSQHTWAEVIDKLRQVEAIVYAVGVGARVDRPRLQELADRSGGAAFFPADVSTLAGDYLKILDELRRRYAVGYESTNRMRDGRWRAVEIRVRQAGTTVRSRGGYNAPGD
jgi:Ca-activated chloride channel family protein